jgi:hypothetical protein
MDPATISMGVQLISSMFGSGGSGGSGSFDFGNLAKGIGSLFGLG